jgi:hypothetical protein
MVIEARDRKGDLAHFLVEQILREAFARAAPFDLLFKDGDGLDLFLKASSLMLLTILPT